MSPKGTRVKISVPSLALLEVLEPMMQDLAGGYLVTGVC